MEVILFATTITSFLVFLLILIHFVKELKFSNFKKRDFPLIIISIIYLIFSIILLFWSIGILKFNEIDFFIVYSIVLIIQTFSLIFLLYRSTKNKKILYSLTSFIIVLPFIFLDIGYIHLTIPISFFITLLSFLILSDHHQKTIPHIVVYSAISLLIYLALLTWSKLIPFLTFISLILFLNFINSLTKQLRQKPENIHAEKFETNSPIIQFLKHFIFIIIITNFIFVGTVSIHELGHITLTKYSNCEDVKIVYDLNGFPRTEINCGDTSNKYWWILSGILLPIILAILLIFGGGEFMKEIGLQIIGFNLIISYLDINSLDFSNTIALFVLIIGVFLSILSLALLAKSKTDQSFKKKKSENPYSSFNHLIGL